MNGTTAASILAVVLWLVFVFTVGPWLTGWANALPWWFSP